MTTLTTRRGSRWARHALIVCALLVAGLAGAVVGHSLLVRIGILPRSYDYAVRGDVALARSDRPGLRVLFVGNSFTFANSMPALVSRLAAGDPGAAPVFAAQYAAPGAGLRDAKRQDELDDLLRQVRWDHVVLQERSLVPSLSRDERRRWMYPAVRTLDERVLGSGARTLLFMTWGYRQGDRSNVPDDTFTAMQARIWRGYAEIANERGASVAPVGLAWAYALARDQSIDLWSPDGRHPSLAGSYLAACVLYAVLSRREPVSTFTAGLEPEQARTLQGIAVTVVDQWQTGRMRSVPE